MCLSGQQWQQAWRARSTHQLVQQTETADGASQFKAFHNDTGAKEGKCSSLDPVKS